MRRNDRQTDEQTALKFLSVAPYAIISFSGDAYCIPVSHAVKNGFIYFHCAKSGAKLDRIKQNPEVCLSAVSYCRPVPDKFTTEFSSAVVFGIAELVNDQSEKIEALRLICEKYTPENMSDFDNAIEKSLAVTEIVKIKINSITGKQKTIKK